VSRYDDEIWRLVPEDAGPPPGHLLRFVQGLGPVETALDLGCGDGRLSVELLASRLTLADVSQVALERARRRLPEAEVVRLEADALLPLEDSTFELVLAAETLEHVRDVQLLLSEARRVLRPGGTLALSTPAHGRLTGLAVLARGFESRFDPLSPHIRFFTARSLRSVLAELGFEVASLWRESGTLMASATR
jgi:ubiquinone/menaquinone biosynthesis C-methylase UbiE